MTRLQQAQLLHQSLKEYSNTIGNLLIDTFHYLTLFAISIAIVWSALVAFAGMIADSHINIEDILLLFIYLELLAMVGIYFKTNHMPVRFLIYVAITALTRMLIGNIQSNHEPDQGILFITGAIFLLALATLVIRYGSSKYPSDDKNLNIPS